jgi:hypothetical protein
MDTNITKTWTVTINEDEVFSRCVNESLYQNNRMGGNPNGDMLVIQDDDRNQFGVYLSAAVAELRMLLARRMEEPELQTNLGLVFKLQMHENHDNNILPVLINHCYEYLVKKVLEQWFHADFGSALEKLEINHCLHYRKNPVRRRLGPLF